MAVTDPRLADLSRHAPGSLVALGFVEETDDHRYTNSAALLRDGELLGHHRKVYLPTYGMFDEGRFTRAGRSDPDDGGGGAAGAHRPERVRGLLAPLRAACCRPRTGHRCS